MPKLLTSRLYCLFHLNKYRYEQQKISEELVLANQYNTNEFDLLAASHSICFINLHQLKNFIKKILIFYDEALLTKNYKQQRQLVPIMETLLLHYVKLQKKEGNLYPKTRSRLSRIIQVHAQKENYTKIVLKLVK